MTYFTDSVSDLCQGIIDKFGDPLPASELEKCTNT